MEDVRIRKQISEAFPAPQAPEALVERTVVRARALTAGRAAEQRLTEGAALSPEEVALLAAESAVGRLMMTAQPPDGVSEGEMTAQLASNERFRSLADRPAGEIVSDLRSGRFLTELAPKKEAEAAPQASPRQIGQIRGPEPPKRDMGPLSR